VVFHDHGRARIVTAGKIPAYHHKGQRGRKPGTE
jgi:hypothetical protein